MKIKILREVEVDDDAVAAVKDTLVAQHHTVFEQQRGIDHEMARRVAATAVAAYLSHTGQIDA